MPKKIIDNNIFNHLHLIFLSINVIATIISTLIGKIHNVRQYTVSNAIFFSITATNGLHNTTILNIVYPAILRSKLFFSERISNKTNIIKNSSNNFPDPLYQEIACFMILIPSQNKSTIFISSSYNLINT